MTLITAPNRGADQPHVTAVKTPQTAITVQAEQVPEESETTAETAFVSEVKKAEMITEKKAEIAEEKAKQKEGAD
jgi:hypothetical protein